MIQLLWNLLFGSYWYFHGQLTTWLTTRAIIAHIIVSSSKNILENNYNILAYTKNSCWHIPNFFWHILYLVVTNSLSVTEDSLLCVGLDPHKSELQEDSAEGAFRFCQHLIEASTWVPSSRQSSVLQVRWFEGWVLIQILCIADILGAKRWAENSSWVKSLLLFLKMTSHVHFVCES